NGVLTWLARLEAVELAAARARKARVAALVARRGDRERESRRLGPRDVALREADAAARGVPPEAVDPQGPAIVVILLSELRLTESTAVAGEHAGIVLRIPPRTCAHAAVEHHALLAVDGEGAIDDRAFGELLFAGGV